MSGDLSSFRIVCASCGASQIIERLHEGIACVQCGAQLDVLTPAGSDEDSEEAAQAVERGAVQRSPTAHGRSGNTRSKAGDSV